MSVLFVPCIGLRVSAAIIRENGKVLIAQRLKDSSFGLKWEFPGGKVEEDESPEECLRRELLEELGIETENLGLFSTVRHSYGDFDVELLFYSVRRVSGELRLYSHERLAWVGVDELQDYDFLEADIQVLEKILGSKDALLNQGKEESL
jgi:8-oxo-dGTP diphosphatase